jgi:two-component sensor histidine kinase
MPNHYNLRPLDYRVKNNVDIVSKIVNINDKDKTNQKELIQVTIVTPN